MHDQIIKWGIVLFVFFLLLWILSDGWSWSWQDGIRRRRKICACSVVIRQGRCAKRVSLQTNGSAVICKNLTVKCRILAGQMQTEELHVGSELVVRGELFNAQQPSREAARTEAKRAAAGGDGCCALPCPDDCVQTCPWPAVRWLICDRQGIEEGLAVSKFNFAVLTSTDAGSVNVAPGYEVIAACKPGYSFVVIDCYGSSSLSAETGVIQGGGTTQLYSGYSVGQLPLSPDISDLLRSTANSSKFFDGLDQIQTLASRQNMSLTLFNTSGTPFTKVGGDDCNGPQFTLVIKYLLVPVALCAPC